MLPQPPIFKYLPPQTIIFSLSRNRKMCCLDFLFEIQQFLAQTKTVTYTRFRRLPATLCAILI